MPDLPPTPCRTVLDWTEDARPIACAGHLHWTATRAWNYGECDRCGRPSAYRPGLDNPPREHLTGRPNLHHPAVGPDREPAA